jgi:hypothetical protein
MKLFDILSCIGVFVTLCIEGYPAVKIVDGRGKA